MPTIVFDDQSIRVEPRNAALAAKLSDDDPSVGSGGSAGLTTAKFAIHHSA